MNEGPSSRERTPGAVTELFNPSTHTWADIREDILQLEDECFPGQGIPEEELESTFDDPHNIIVLLRKGAKIVGFSAAIPDESVQGAVYIETTEIHPDEQGKGYVASIMNVLENEARTRGYTFLTRNAAVGNGYADKIQKNYGERISQTYENDSEYGPQRYFKIKL
jgi:ribosomal protein S18 acetylase RimI-like enzyme